ncbi:hypothetical protein FOZ63_030104, partial [Perkinsus olseni]
GFVSAGSVEMYTPPARDIFGDDDVGDKQLAPQHVLRDPAECPYAADGVGIEGQCMVVLTPVLPTQNSSFNALDFNRYVMVQEFKRAAHMLSLFALSPSSCPFRLGAVCARVHPFRLYKRLMFVEHATTKEKGPEGGSSRRDMTSLQNYGIHMKRVNYGSGPLEREKAQEQYGTTKAFYIFWLRRQNPSQLVEVRPESERTLDDADVHLLQKRIAAMVESKVRIFTKLSAEAFHEEGIYLRLYPHPQVTQPWTASGGGIAFLIGLASRLTGEENIEQEEDTKGK